MPEHDRQKAVCWWFVLSLVLAAAFAPHTSVQGQTIPPANYLPLITNHPGYEFNVGFVVRCDPNAGITYVNGYTKHYGQPISGKQVAFSWQADGPIVAQIESGPHPGYPGWPPGFWSHILDAGGPRAGDWYFWIVDAAGERISRIVHLRTDGEAGEGRCQQALIEFDRQA
jgi:hypothetical protein